MNKNAELWIETLRAEKFQQAPGSLRKASGYCCLGVACELHLLAHGKRWDSSYGVAFTYLGAGADLPNAVKDWLGMKSRSGGFSSEYKVEGYDIPVHGLMQANDMGIPFSIIADIIDARADELFEPDET